MGQKVFLKIAFRLLNQPKQDFIDMRNGFSKSGVPPNSVLFGGTVPPNSFPLIEQGKALQEML